MIDYEGVNMEAENEQDKQDIQAKPIKKPNNKPPKKPMNGWLIALCVICGCIVFTVFWSNFFSNLSAPTTEAYIPLGDTIDVIHVEGTIMEGDVTYNHNWTLNQIDSLMYNDSNKAIMLYVNSPGGGIYESDELYLKLKEYKEVTGRPVYAYMAQQATSGGLYVCMAADKVYANRMTMTGSIGVIMSVVDTTGLEELIGIKQENIVSGENKAMGNPLTASQKEILQSLIDESYDIFVSIVAENRGIDEATVRSFADGRVYSPLQAKELHLIDEIGDYNAAVEDLRETYGLQDCECYTEKEPMTFWEELMYTKSNLDGMSSKFEDITSYINNHSGLKIMYMVQE